MNGRVAKQMRRAVYQAEFSSRPDARQYEVEHKGNGRAYKAQGMRALYRQLKKAYRHWGKVDG